VKRASTISSATTTIFIAIIAAASSQATGLRELAPEKKDEALFGQFLSRLKQLRVWPQIILYSPEEAARLAAI